MTTDPRARLQSTVEATLTRTGWGWRLAVASCLGLVALGVWAYSLAVRRGLAVTGLAHPVMWGVLIATFVFFIGVSHSGTLVSAILYLTRSRVRASIGRSAEAMTVVAVLTAGFFPVLHLGRPWLFFWVMPYPNSRALWVNFRSPLVWDVFAIGAYVLVSMLFLYMGMLPDLAVLGRRLGGWRGRAYRRLALGFSGTDGEWALHQHAYLIFAGIVIPLAVSVHSVVSWDFAMALTPGWHSTIFAPYFVAGAIFSGVAMAITVLALLRRGYRLHAYIRTEHFEMLARLLVTMSLLMSLVYATEYFAARYRGDESEWRVYAWRATGRYAPLFWIMVACNCLVPLAAFSARVRRSVGALFVISLAVNVGMYIERVVIVVTSLARNQDPYTWGTYAPRPVEIAIVAGAFGWFALLLLLFVKLFPSVSLAETKEALVADDEAASHG